MIAAENFAGRGRAENTQFPARFKIDFFRKKIVNCQFDGGKRSADFFMKTYHFINFDSSSLSFRISALFGSKATTCLR